MTQGYPNDSSDGGAWGQPEPQRPAPQQPAGHPSPGSAPQPGTPYPGTPYPGASPSGPAFGTPSTGFPGPVPGGSGSVREAVAPFAKWLFIGAIAVVVARTLAGLSSFAWGFLMGYSTTAMDYDDVNAMGSIGALLVIGLIGLVVLVSTAELILAIVVAVKAQGRGRTGAIIIAATIGASFLLYWILRIVSALVLSAAMSGSMGGVGGMGAMSVISIIIEVLHWAVVAAALIVGAIMVRRWAAERP